MTASSTFLRGYITQNYYEYLSFLSIRQTQEIIMNISGYTAVIKLILRGPAGGGGGGGGGGGPRSIFTFFIVFNRGDC